MFRDITNKKSEKGVPINVDYSRCPYCESLVTEEYEREPTKNGMWIEPIDCEICGNPYTIIYNEDQTFSHIIRDKVKLNISKRNSERSTMTKMGRLKCKSCGALAHEVVEGTPYCGDCVPRKKNKNIKKATNDLVIDCGCGHPITIPSKSTIDEKPIEEGCCATEKKSFWKKLFCKSNLY